MKLDSRFLAEIPVVAAVVEAGSFVGAGKTLGLSQSAVSRALQRLEHRLGTRLLDRNSQIVRLTESGRRFCEEVLPLLARLTEAAEETGRSSASVRGKLRVNVDPTFARLVLIPRLAAFLESWPDLELELAVRESVGDLISDGFDAAIRFGPPQPYALLVRRLLQVRVLTCAAPEFLQRHGRPRTPRNLATKRLPCLLFRDPITGEPYPWEFHRGQEVVTVPVAGRITMSDPVTYLEACLAGLGVGQLFELGSETFLHDGRLINLFPAWTDERFPLYVYHASRDHVPAKLRVFLDFISALSNEHSVKGDAAYPAD